MQLATMRIESGGIKFAVEESRALMGMCFLQKDLFEEYKYKESPPLSSEAEGEASDQVDQFKLNLSTLIDCLNIFGGSTGSFTSLQIIYKGYGNPLFLMYTPPQFHRDDLRASLSVSSTAFILSAGWRRTKCALTVVCALWRPKEYQTTTSERFQSSTRPS